MSVQRLMLSAAVAAGMLGCRADQSTPLAPVATAPLTSAASTPVLSVVGHFGRLLDGPPPSFEDDDPAPWANVHSSFEVHLSEGGTLTGQVRSLSFLFFLDQKPWSWNEDVVCLVVEGNEAWIGTVVTRVSPNTDPILLGRRYVYHLVDTSPADLLQRGRDMDDCGAKPALPLVLATQGDLRIIDRR